MKKTLTVIGAGLAGVEASYQLAKRGFLVHLYEMKPKEFSPAHKSDSFAELVCSNSLRSNELTNSAGLLKEELRVLDSIIIKTADMCSVPAGGALAVDREVFSSKITEQIKNNPNIIIHNERVDKIDVSTPTIIATGPLTASALSENLKELIGQNYLYFFDAAAPIVTHDSIDFTKAYLADRYDKGDGDYVNCPMTKEEYNEFYEALINAETAKLKDFENEKVFEGCMPVEVMAKRGEKSLLFGPLKPVGLKNPVTGKTDYAVVQLRKENVGAKLYNLVGFQTNLTFKEQKRVFSLIPALKNAEFVKYGVMHRNTFLNAPSVLNKYYQLKLHNNIFIAGQLSGVEGYIESVSSGLYAAINMANFINQKQFLTFLTKTAIGAMAHYIANANKDNFQPMNINWGIIDELQPVIRDKKQKKVQLAQMAIKSLQNTIKEGEQNGTI
ncbi:MAG: methylenetetrahydrofolate--tRNA-(uracil(54)-C(5))-methyltransferase (FADH(2)-oxidizing) TrmFO [Tenericutes bacterium HGW-Tenericutes-4]|jgi:methylenetetrahydrofolate--tRNA-(uracil-5-)-methyltransferase|nr:MAG: methylenetetrahydrofolate--tRNA-(uracil(54)-C(5))-methyltransferase (FADH(2)-oxidizing) TrmFO [Tenericutes bacterium HGW-Tenericutes-4]